MKEYKLLVMHPGMLILNFFVMANSSGHIEGVFYFYDEKGHTISAYPSAYTIIESIKELPK